MDTNQKIKPPTSTPPSTTPIQESTATWYFILAFCGFCTFASAVFAVVMLVHAFAVFRIKDPTLALNTIYFNNLQVLMASPVHPISINATWVADISIGNPNVALLQFDSSLTSFYYTGEVVGLAYAPWTEVPAQGTLRMNVTVDVLADRLSMLTNATTSAMTYGCLNLTSYTYLHGRVTVLKIFKKHMKVMMNCSMTLDMPLSSQQLKNKICQAYVQ